MTKMINSLTFSIECIVLMSLFCLSNEDATTEQDMTTMPVTDATLDTSAPPIRTPTKPFDTTTVRESSSSRASTAGTPAATDDPIDYSYCPSLLPCDQLSGDCLDCNLPASCIYGRTYNTTCVPKPGLECTGEQELQRSYKCRYCYQTEPWEQICTPANNCTVNACPKQMVQVNCSVLDDVLCLGRRRFYKKKECNWTSGYKWSTAFILSITLGGLGADRFYLGYWESGLGKFFSFGGVGIWTLIDILLIGVGYIPPGDGSVYV